MAFRAPATKVRQNLSIVAKNENSTEHFVHLHNIWNLYQIPFFDTGYCFYISLHPLLGMKDRLWLYSWMLSDWIILGQVKE